MMTARHLRNALEDGTVIFTSTQYDGSSSLQAEYVFAKTALIFARRPVTIMMTAHHLCNAPEDKRHLCKEARHLI